MNLKKLLSVAFMLAAAGSVTSAAGPAKAHTEENCHVTAVGIYGSGQYLNIYCDGVQHTATLSAAPNCTSTSPDAMKAYISMAEAALLSGKPLTVSVDGDPNCQYPAINYVSLKSS